MVQLLKGHKTHENKLYSRENDLVSECIDDILAGCDDSYKAIARWDIAMYTSTFLGGQCSIISDQLNALPETSLVLCMEVLENRAYNTSEDVCDAIGDYVECVR